MEIKSTKSALQEMLEHSEKLKRGFESMVRTAPQILNEDDLDELKKQTTTLAANFDTCASHLYSFSRMGLSSKKFAPK